MQNRKKIAFLVSVSWEPMGLAAITTTRAGQSTPWPVITLRPLPHGRGEKLEKKGSSSSE
ncbi:hypothetical protein E2C01_067635 [Portunus trituberculatus]|uniref:Uncharacterized protein n=1 Tax=Portunus trituberculatus TaxID=210409 RepID=A0A5B7HKB7_PORTR|nr:hypothetical protein [Portunus trituberculatus]